MGEEWLITNGMAETVIDFEVVAEQLHRAEVDPYRWKWAVVALHSGLQGAMVAALQGSHGLHVLRPEDASRWLVAHERGGPYPTNLKLDGFLCLYRKIKGDKMLKYVNSRKFTPQGTQGDSVKMLNRLRNEFVHFTPRVWALELEGLPLVSSDCLDVAEFLLWDSKNCIWREKLYDRAREAFSLARNSIARLKGTCG